MANIKQAKAQTNKIKSTLSKLSGALFSNAIPREDPIVVNTSNLQSMVEQEMPNGMDNKEVALPQSADKELACGRFIIITLKGKFEF